MRESEKQGTDFSRSRIYFDHGSTSKLLGVRATVDGKPALAYVKQGEIVSYVLFEDLCKNILTSGPCYQINSSQL